MRYETSTDCACFTGNLTGRMFVTRRFYGRPGDLTVENSDEKRRRSGRGNFGGPGTVTVDGFGQRSRAPEVLSSISRDSSCDDVQNIFRTLYLRITSHAERRGDAPVTLLDGISCISG
jgi:hypothetical protein